MATLRRYTDSLALDKNAQPMHDRVQSRRLHSQGLGCAAGPLIRHLVLSRMLTRCSIDPLTGSPKILADLSARDLGRDDPLSTSWFLARTALTTKNEDYDRTQSGTASTWTDEPSMSVLADVRCPVYRHTTDSMSPIGGASAPSGPESCTMRAADG